MELIVCCIGVKETQDLGLKLTGQLKLENERRTLGGSQKLCTWLQYGGRKTTYVFGTDRYGSMGLNLEETWNFFTRKMLLLSGVHVPSKSKELLRASSRSNLVI